MELTAGGRILAEAKNQRGIFQGNALSPLLLVIEMMPLNHIHRKCTAGYHLGKSLEKINPLMYMDDIKLFAKNGKKMETLIHALRIYGQGIGMEFGIEKYAIVTELIAATGFSLIKNIWRGFLKSVQNGDKPRMNVFFIIRNE